MAKSAQPPTATGTPPATQRARALADQLQQLALALITRVDVISGTVTVETSQANLRELALLLRDHADFRFDMLIDLCAVDYLQYGKGEWETTTATSGGFSRGVHRVDTAEPGSASAVDAQAGASTAKVPLARFAVVYHLLSLSHNVRVRLRVFVQDKRHCVDSVVDIWPAANWYEREAFDLFGIFFKNHPDLRRLLTDYGFVGHPFRKDFPLIGKVEMRYDAAQGRCVYEPVSIEPRVLQPKVVRQRAGLTGQRAEQKKQDNQSE